MKANSILTAVVVFVLGGVVGYVMTQPSAVNAEPAVAQISALELTLKAGQLPVHTANAI